MVPQMNNKCSDTYELDKQRRREQLIEQCIQLGMPVVGDEDEETLETYIDIAHDDDWDDFDNDDEDLNNCDTLNDSSSVKKTNILGRLFSLFM